MGANSLTSIVGGVIQITHPNQYFTALNQDFVPRNISGVATDSGGSLGSSTYRWSNLYTSGTIQIGTLANNNKILESSSDLVLKTNDAQSLRIQSNGRSVFGTVTSSLSAGLTVYTSGSLATPNANADEFQIQNNSTTGSHCGMSIIAGNAANSAIYFGDADNTSIGSFEYDHGNDRFIFYVAGATRGYWDSSGLGIGTVPTSGVTLHLYSTNPIFRLQDTDGSYLNYSFNASQIVESIHNGSVTRASRSASADADGISHSFSCHGITGTDKFRISYTNADASTQAVRIQCTDSTVSSSHTMLALEFDSDSDVTSAKFIDFRDGSGSIGYVEALNSTTAQFVTSDKRLKTNYRDFYAMKVIEKLNPIMFDWINGGQADWGLLAQDTYEVFPELVAKPEKEEDRWFMCYDKLIPFLLKGIKELNDKIKVLENK